MQPRCEMRKGLVWGAFISLLIFGQVTELDAQTSRFAYVANGGSQDVSAYSINAMTGELTEVTGSPFRAGVGPYWVAIDPAAKFVYVANQNSGDVSAFAIDPTT